MWQKTQKTKVSNSITDLENKSFEVKHFTENQAVELAATINQSTCLNTLRIINCTFENQQSLITILEAVKMSPSIQYLDIQRCGDDTPELAKAISEAKENVSNNLLSPCRKTP